MTPNWKYKSKMSTIQNESLRMARGPCYVIPRPQMIHIPSDKLVMVLRGKEMHKCLEIDVAIQNPYNTQKKGTEEMNNYVDLQIKCQRIWNKKVKIVPVIISATGVAENNLKKHLSRVPWQHNMHNLQKSGILGTAHILIENTIHETKLNITQIPIKWNPGWKVYTWWSMGSRQSLITQTHYLNNNINNNKMFYLLTIHKCHQLEFCSTFLNKFTPYNFS